jgi:hypothetical protein
LHARYIPHNIPEIFSMAENLVLGEICFANVAQANAVAVNRV